MDKTGILLDGIQRNKKVIIGGWSSAPYGTRIESIGKFQFPHVGAKYRAITLRGAVSVL